MMAASSVSSKPIIDVEMISDTVRYKKLNMAIDAFKAEGNEVDFALHFEPFQLDPTLPLASAVSKRERYIKKFGGAERVAAMEQAMIARGKEVGIAFSYGGNLRHTRDSHRLLAKAHELGGEAKQRKVAERLFAAYFEQEQDIGDLDVLAAASAECDVLDDAATRAFLKSPEGIDEYEKGIARAQGLGVSGVPFFILSPPGDGRPYAISGAQDIETFLQVFRRIAPKSEKL